MHETPRIRMIGATLASLRSQWWDRERIAAYQRKRLVEMLRHAVTSVPFYEEIGVAARDIESDGALRHFPIVRKADVQAQGERFLARAFAGRKLYGSRSSGMTGRPTATYFDDDSWTLTKYALKARRVLSDVRSPWQRVLIMSASPGRAWAFVASLGFVRVRYMSPAEPGALTKHAAELAAFSPTMIYGFPSYLLALADTARERNLVLPSVPLIYTSSELLTDVARAGLERAYCGRVVDVYGSSEFKEIAVQCKHGRYHINFESVYVESVRERQDEPPRLLVTGLVNRAMPLIRYELGDIGEIIEAHCRCGRSSPQIGGLQGRLADMIEFPDGTRVSPYALEDVIEQHAWVRYFDLVHESAWAVRVELLPIAEVTADDRRQLEQRLRERLPAQVSLRLVDLTNRPAAPTKRRAVSREFQP